MQRTYRYEEMLPDEFLQAVADFPVFIVPTGLLEWHADHLTHMDQFNEIPKHMQYYKNPANSYRQEETDWRFGAPVLPRACPQLGAKAVDIISDHIVSKLRAALAELLDAQ